MTEQSYVIGLFKFADKLGYDTILEVAKEWAKEPEFVHLYVRKASKDQIGIGFSYISKGSKDPHDEFRNKYSDILKRKFGNDLVGWDISTCEPEMLVKGF